MESKDRPPAGEAISPALLPAVEAGVVYLHYLSGNDEEGKSESRRKFHQILRGLTPTQRLAVFQEMIRKYHKEKSRRSKWKQITWNPKRIILN